MRSLRRQGFSIVQVLVAAVMMAAIVLALTQALRSLQLGQKGVSSAVDFDTLKTSVLNIVKNKQLCGTAFYNAANTAVAKFNPSFALPDNQTVGTIRLGDSVVAQENTEISSGLLLEDLALTLVPGTSQTVTATEISADVNLVMRAKKTASQVGGANLSTELNPLRLRIVVDATSFEIKSCYSPGASAPSGGLQVIERGIEGSDSAAAVPATLPTGKSFTVNSTEWTRVQVTGTWIGGTPTPVWATIQKDQDTGDWHVMGSVTQSGVSNQVVNDTNRTRCFGSSGYLMCIQKDTDGKLKGTSSGIAFSYEVFK